MVERRANGTLRSDASGPGQLVSHLIRRRANSSPWLFDSYLIQVILHLFLQTTIVKMPGKDAFLSRLFPETVLPLLARRSFTTFVVWTVLVLVALPLYAQPTPGFVQVNYATPQTTQASVAVQYAAA